ncbi:hypothetical protein T265_13530, partial [Opisthorchis viverrini]
MNVRRTIRLAAGGFVSALAAFEAQVNLRNFQQTDNVKDDTSRSFLLRAKSFLQPFNALSSACAQTTTIPPKVTPWDWNWDGRHPQSSVVQATGDNSDGQLKRNTCSRHLIFIRHGQYHYAESDEECRLTQLGREQLDLTGLRLKHLKFPYSIVHYSTMTRAVESTEEVLKHLPGVKAIPSDLLREGAPYPLEPPLPYYRPTAEELKRDGDRIETAFKSFVHRPDCGQTRDTYEIFICHANVIRYFVCRALQFPPEAWIRFSLDHGSITWLVIRSDGRVVLRCLGNSGYMPQEKISVQ